MPNWEQVARLSDCPPGSVLEVVAGKRVCATLGIEAPTELPVVREELKDRLRVTDKQAGNAPTAQP